MIANRNKSDHQPPLKLIKADNNSYSKIITPVLNEATVGFTRQLYEIMIGRRASDHYLISEKPLESGFFDAHSILPHRKAGVY